MKKETWRLDVIIDDMWSVYKGDTEDQLALLVRDIKGDTIQVTVMNNDIGAWKPKLAVGKTYQMNNFRVFDNDSDYKMTTHKYRLTLVGAKKIEEALIPDIPPTKFNFKDFSEIHSGKYTPDLLVDAIGVIHEFRKCVTASTTRKAQVSFTLKDLRDTIIDCTLWDSLSVEFMTSYNQRSDSGPIVIIIKHARVKEPQGVYPIQLTNVWNDTKLIFDTSVPEIKAFLNNLPDNVTYLTQTPIASKSTHFYTQTSAGSQHTSDDNWMKGARILSLGDMKKLKVDTYCVTTVTTKKVKVSNHEWFFRACRECNLKAEGKVPPYICKKGHQENDPLIKYKVDVEVFDGDEEAKFVFWDSSLEELLGMTASTLHEKQCQIGCPDAVDYPDDLDDIMHRKFAFRVKWQPGWGGQGSIVHCKDSQELVAKIQEHLPVAESAVKDIETIAELPDDVISISDSPPIQNFTSSDIKKFAKLDDAILSTPNVTSPGDTDMSDSSHKTPAKRVASKTISIDQTNLDAQFSSTRVTKLIKKEMP
ncbi:replication protein A 70 kDa DNA-binding subunit B [Trifolium repens]|nr:replication protein A 70 kDa DNA-binding subunit B [Trifolium repens]